MIKKPIEKIVPEIISFKTSPEWRKWLSHNRGRQAGIWLRLYKKDSGIPTITHSQALDEALCFGWIDGLGKKLDAQSWILKFTPRRSKSLWSKRNQENVTRLIQEKRMTKYGLAEITAAKKDGRWDAAYDSPKNMIVPEGFITLLSTDKKAEIFFKQLDKANVYAIAWRLQTAKNPQIRQKRMDALFAMLKAGKKLH
jgi:uncharacterized protein YdeI (YjbR/CyaY-like superfamily)